MIPSITKQNSHAILTVHGVPYIMIAGEVHNSNSSSVEYMEGVWDKAEALGMNTLLLPIPWETVEPAEGIFDFTLVDGLIHQARCRGKKLVFLWFGIWKNAECMYAPAWVKTDLNRFRRAQVFKGQNKAGLPKVYNRPYTSISYLCDEARDADARAFAHLMAHLREIDGEENTVLAVQVENETGVLGAGREHSDEADRMFCSPVPQDFAEYMRSHTVTMHEDVRQAVEAGAASGTWEEVFGPVAEEVFSAYQISRTVNTIAEAGKAEYPLPMAVNCWLNKAGEEPGDYPSGGPVARMREVWGYSAPAIDLYCPDIYVPNFCEVCDEYTSKGDPLFIPECATHSYAASRMVYSIGHHHALCYAPFGFEDIGEPFSGMQGLLFGMDVTDPALKTPQNVEEYAVWAKTLNEMMPLLTERYGTNDLQAACCENSDHAQLIFGTFGVHAILNHPMIEKKDGVCLGLKLAEDECYLLVNRCGLRLFSCDPSKPHLDLLDFEEGRFENGQWHMIRRLNGDEAAFMKYDTPTILRVRVFSYA